MQYFSWRNFNLLRVVGYIVLTPIAYKLGWLNSVTFVSLLSIWALVESAVAAWRSDVPTKANENESSEPSEEQK